MRESFWSKKGFPPTLTPNMTLASCTASSCTDHAAPNRGGPRGARRLLHVVLVCLTAVTAMPIANRQSTFSLCAATTAPRTNAQSSTATTNGSFVPVKQHMTFQDVTRSNVAANLTTAAGMLCAFGLHGTTGRSLKYVRWESPWLLSASEVERGVDTRKRSRHAAASCSPEAGAHPSQCDAANSVVTHASSSDAWTLPPWLLPGLPAVCAEPGDDAFITPCIGSVSPWLCHMGSAPPRPQGGHGMTSGGSGGAGTSVAAVSLQQLNRHLPLVAFTRLVGRRRGDDGSDDGTAPTRRGGHRNSKSVWNAAVRDAITAVLLPTNQLPASAATLSAEQRGVMHAPPLLTTTFRAHGALEPQRQPSARDDGEQLSQRAAMYVLRKQPRPQKLGPPGGSAIHSPASELLLPMYMPTELLPGWLLSYAMPLVDDGPRGIQPLDADDNNDHPSSHVLSLLHAATSLRSTVSVDEVAEHLKKQTTRAANFANAFPAAPACRVLYHSILRWIATRIDDDDDHGRHAGADASPSHRVPVVDIAVGLGATAVAPGYRVMRADLIVPMQVWIAVCGFHLPFSDDMERASTADSPVSHRKGATYHEGGFLGWILPLEEQGCQEILDRAVATHKRNVTGAPSFSEQPFADQVAAVLDGQLLVAPMASRSEIERLFAGTLFSDTKGDGPPTGLSAHCRSAPRAFSTPVGNTAGGATYHYWMLP